MPSRSIRGASPASPARPKASNSFSESISALPASIPHRRSATWRNGMLQGYDRGIGCGDEDCEHGILSPRAEDAGHEDDEDDEDGEGRGRRDEEYGDYEREAQRTEREYENGDGRYHLGAGMARGAEWMDGARDEGDGDGGGTQKGSWYGWFDESRKAATGFLDWRRRDRWRTMQVLARQHGIRNQKRMYLAYYIPFWSWITHYQWKYFTGDMIAALTMASFYLPMALSYASNLGHIPPIHGLYSFVFNPLIYALLGTSAQMVVGPEAAGSLLVGQVVRNTVDKGHSGDDDELMNARIAGVVTGMAGAVILTAGLTRLGFLESVLSRPFLRGFISAIGVVIFVDQLIPQMGLGSLARGSAGVSHGSSVDKLAFLFHNIKSAHALTCWVSFGSFGVIMLFRTLKQRFQPRIPAVAYIPDRFLVVALSAVLAHFLDWESAGLEILGEIKSSTGAFFTFHWPFLPAHMTHVREAMSTSFLIALLGFFESSVAAKALTNRPNASDTGIEGVSLSANRELVALGVANLVGGCFMALPAFGGYGRSKVNASTGGRTPMSSVFLSLITVVCVLFLLPYFYYIPKGVLSAMISVVAYSLVEECPQDIRFFIRIRGFSELTLMFLIFAATIFYSLTLGVALGMGLSILSVIRHATAPRIQILGRVPGTADRFENAEARGDGDDDAPAASALQFPKGCLIIKMPEPLTFANTGDLTNRLRRLERYGTTAAHPALPRLRAPNGTRAVVFDVHGVTSLDGSGAQVLRDIVAGYVARGVRVWFCRGPGARRGPVWRRFVRSGIVALCGGPEHFVLSVEEALASAEAEGGWEGYEDEPHGVEEGR